MELNVKNNLTFLRDGIEIFDNDGEKSLYFYEHPSAKAELIVEILTHSTFHVDHLKDPISTKLRVNEIMKWLDSNFQAYAWAAHEVHFHTNFMQHSICPYTCLNEISSILEKMIKEKFAS